MKLSFVCQIKNTTKQTKLHFRMMRKPVVEKAAFLHDERQRRVKPKRRMWTAPDAAAVQRQGTGRDGLEPRRALTWPVRQSETRQP